MGDSIFSLRDTDFFGLFTVAGCALGIFFFTRRKQALPLLPGLWFLARYIMDLGMGPYFQVSLGLYPFAMFGFSSHEAERIDALFLGLQGGTALAIGFLIGKWLRRPKTHPTAATPSKVMPIHPYSPIAWQMTIILGMIGCALWMLWIHQAGGLAAALGGMRTRLFSTGFEEETPFSVYIRMGADLLQLSALIMIGLSGGPQKRRFLTCCVVALSVFFLFLTGGRTRTAFFLLSCALVLHERVRKLSFADIGILAACAAALMLTISFIRGSGWASGPAPIMMTVINSFLPIDRVESIAWMQSVFPEKVAFTNGTSLLRSLVTLFPILEIPGVSSMWGIIADNLYGGYRHSSGSGGWNFHGAAELYMNFGVAGVWAGYLVLGLVLALLFSHLRDRRHELFPSVALAVALTAFSVGVGTRPNDTLVSVLLEFWMLGCMAATMTWRDGTSQTVLGLSFACMLLFFGWKLMGIDELKLALGLCMFIWLPLSIRLALTTRDASLR